MRYEEAKAQILSGYRIISSQSNPSSGWLQMALENLVIIYEAMGKPEEAARFRAELEKAS